MKERRVLVTASDGERLCALLRARGDMPLAIPTIEIRRLPGDRLDAALRRGSAFDWIIVTSPNGAAAVFDRIRELGLAPPRGPRWAAVGPATRDALEEEGIVAAFVPDGQRAAAIPQGLGALDGRRVLLLRSRTGTPELPRALRARGAAVDDVPAYETIEGPESSRTPLRAALTRPVDVAVFTSGSTVRGFVRLVEDPVRALAGSAIVAIGPTTARAAVAAGLGPARIAADRTPEGLLAAVEESGRVRA